VRPAALSFGVAATRGGTAIAQSADSARFPPGIHLLGRAPQFNYVTNLGGLTLSQSTIIQSNGTVELNLVITRNGVIWLSIIAAHRIAKSTPQTPVQVSMRFGAPFRGIRSANFTVSADKIVKGSIDGKDIIPHSVVAACSVRPSFFFLQSGYLA
jgi:hypothetical protein